jgi:hypothetical protein
VGQHSAVVADADDHAGACAIARQVRQALDEGSLSATGCDV